MIERLVVFGATGDLAGRFLLPALVALEAAGKLPQGFQMIGASRQPLDDDAFRRLAEARLDEHAGDMPAAARSAVVGALSYRQADVTEAQSLVPLVESADGPLAAYLAVPPALYLPAVSALEEVHVPAGSRIVLEKPFGEDLQSVIALNQLLATAFGPDRDDVVYGVDHVLGLPTVQNLLALRLSNPVLEAFWNSRHVERVEVLWEETLGLEGRADYYDEAGALRDVIQNHVLQILALIAMELPAERSGRALRERKLDALRSIRPIQRDEMVSRTRRARYTAGRLAPPPEGSGEAIPAYADEEGVDPKRKTETFAELVFELESERWAGTSFVLRAGKALARRRKMAILRFCTTGDQSSDDEESSQLSIGVDGPEILSFELAGGSRDVLVPVALTAQPPKSELPAYGHVLMDVLSGGSGLSVSCDGAEQSWRVVEPVLDAWHDDLVPLDEYVAGSAGPASLTEVTRSSARS